MPEEDKKANTKKTVFFTKDCKLLELSSSVNAVFTALTAPLTRGAPLLSFNAAAFPTFPPFCGGIARLGKPHAAIIDL